jgi:hypothetical protein
MVCSSQNNSQCFKMNNELQPIERPHFYLSFFSFEKKRDDTHETMFSKIVLQKWIKHIYIYIIWCEQFQPKIVHIVSDEKIIQIS